MNGWKTLPGQNLTGSQRVSYSILTWSIAVIGLVVYGFTLNHRATPMSLGFVSQVCGGQWQPNLKGPLVFIFGLPFRLLPLAARPLALNFATAALGLAALGLLARCVLIWPWDRSPNVIQNVDKANSAWQDFLIAWLPPIVATAALGLNLSFWEHATAATGEIINVLVMAWVVRCLLEYRLDHRENWLVLAAFAYAADLTNDAALIALLPGFIWSVIGLLGWRDMGLRLVKLGFGVFGVQGRSLKSELVLWRPVGWIVLAFAAGLLFYLLLPLAHQFSGLMPISFWDCLKFNFKNQETWLLTMKRYLTQDYRYISLGLGSLVPLLFISVRWKFAGAQDAVSRWILLFGHLAVALTCGWVLLDANFSPRRLVPGVPLLTNYFFCALALGYCVRYLLLIFTGQSSGARTRRRHGFKYLLNRFKKWLRLVAAGLLVAFSLLLVGGLALRNGPQIRLTNMTLPGSFERRVLDQLPPGPKVIIADDPAFLELARLQLLGKPAARDALFFDTASAVWIDYNKIQATGYPAAWSKAFSQTTNHGQVPLQILERLIVELGAERTFYCLHQSPGILLERYNLKPDGLYFTLELNRAASYLVPKPDPQTVSQCEEAWTNFDREMLPMFTNSAADFGLESRTRVGGTFVRLFQLPAERNRSALFYAGYYSWAADYWGVELQKLGRWKEAASQFQRAIQLNDENVVAKINLDFNQYTQSGKTNDQPLLDDFTPYRNREQAVTAGGPLDDPHDHLATGLAFVNEKLWRQAICEFDRAFELEPRDFDAALSLAALYAAIGKPELSLQLVQQIREQAGDYSVQPAHTASLRMIEARAFLTEGKTNAAAAALNDAVTAASTNLMVVVGGVNLLLQAGLSADVIDLLDRLVKQQPENSTIWALRGTALLRLERFAEAERDLTRSLELNPKNNAARIERATARLKLNRMTEAAQDYQTVLQRNSGEFWASYGLALIALQHHDDPEAIKQFENFLKFAPKTLPEYAGVTNRLATLHKNKAGGIPAATGDAP